MSDHWHPRDTLLFMVGTSIALWVLIAIAVKAVLR